MVGGGIFGSVIALEFAKAGHTVSLFEAAGQLISKASYVNQARLHTGMHYPRDFETAKSAREDHDRFVEYFGDAVRPVDQHYAVSVDSKVSFEEFLDFGARIGNSLQTVNPGEWFREGVVSGMVKVEESTIDFLVLRSLITERLIDLRVHVALSSPVTAIKQRGTISVETSEKKQDFDQVVIATYALAERFAEYLGINFPKMKKQVTEVVLGTVPSLENTGITLMDGPFWSVMPFGRTGLHSLTSVPHTPLNETRSNLLSCQLEHGRCGLISLFDCNGCAFRPAGNRNRIISQFRNDVRDSIRFSAVRSLFAVKSLPGGRRNSETDARPSELHFSPDGNIAVVHSGKIGSSIPIAHRLLNQVS